VLSALIISALLHSLLEPVNLISVSICLFPVKESNTFLDMYLSCNVEKLKVEVLEAHHELPIKNYLFTSSFVFSCKTEN
jgi:hypothetical protein